MDNDDDVFATSINDRYTARSPILINMCLVTFAVNYNVAQGNNELLEVEESDADELSKTEGYDTCTKITLKDGLGYMHKRKQEAIFHARRYKLQKEPQIYYHSKLILFHPQKNKDDLITGFNSDMESYIDKQDVIHKNAKSFNEDCKRFHSAFEAFENDVIPHSAWDSLVPSIAEENAVTNNQGIQTIQMTTKEEEHDDTFVKRHDTNVQVEIDPLSRLYAKIACTHMMIFQNYCSRMQSLNRKQCEIVMYNRAWCKSYIDGM